MEKVNVLVVDDSEQFLKAFCKFLESDADFNITGKSKSGEEAIEMANLLKPDLVLMDYSMPGIGGIEALKTIKSKLSTIKSIMITNHNEQEYRQQAELVGANGFILKSDINEDTLNLIKTIIKHKPELK
tara:strand:+ start:5438 stop:5824 length:387 start_codon:yes stop_codon:yes gene_type:complete